jgi:hypothetical protein
MKKKRKKLNIPFNFLVNRWRKWMSCDGEEGLTLFS